MGYYVFARPDGQYNHARRPGEICRDTSPTTRMTPEALLKEHKEWAIGLARRQHAKLPPSFDIDDLIQEALIELCKRAERYDESKNDNFRGYAYTPILGAIRMSTRRRHFKAATGEDIGAPEALRAVRAQSEQRANDALSRQREQWRDVRRKALIRRKLKRLTPEDAAIARRVLIDGESMQEVARDLGLKERAIKGVLRRAVTALRGHSGEISRGQRALLRALKESAGQVMTQAQLAKKLERSEISIRKQMKELKARGLLKVRRSGNSYIKKEIDRKNIGARVSKVETK